MNHYALAILLKCYETKSEELDLGKCGLTDVDFEEGGELDITLSKCSHLRYLTFSNKVYDFIAQQFKEGLNEDHDNKFTKIPLAVSKLIHLKKLAFNGDDAEKWEVSELSPISKLFNLEELYLCWNNLSEIEDLKNLTSLRKLDLFSNSLTNISPLEKLINLHLLDLRANRIAAIDGLGELVNLKQLFLSGNKLEGKISLPYLKNLEELELNDNQIKRIDILHRLPKLEQLSLSFNKITDIVGLEKLDSLEFLSVQNNNIKTIKPLLPLIKAKMPVLLHRNHRLESGITLYNNPIETPSVEILNLGNDAIINYFEEIERKGSKPLNECKLIFIGDGGAGKTSLMRRLVYNEFNENEITTHGINKIAWRGIKNKTGEDLRINLWDFGGQHIQHSLHQFFFTERVIYVLVLNPRNDEKAAYWLEQVKKLGDGSKILVVYNWKQEQDKQANFLSNFYELRKKYPDILGPYLLSCKQPQSESIFKNELISTIQDHEELKDVYPTSWYNIKNTVENKVTVGENYVSYEQYRQWCIENDYIDDDKQKSLLRTLNRIGSIVFFDKPVLDRLHVLNPEWITTGAYAILTSEITKEKHGHITYQELKEIFKDAKEIFSDKTIRIQYTEEQFGFIIQLMLQYDLCQENPRKKTEYLVPSSFKGKPDKDHHEHKEDARKYRVQFEAPFEMLIIQRFIARKIADAFGEDYWQSGIFIKDSLSKTYALIETNLYSYRIDFWIKGRDVRGLWESVRRDLHEILSIYKKLDYKEEVSYRSDDKEVFIPYQEMLNCLHKGVLNIPYHPTFEISNLSVLDVLEMFEDTSKLKSQLKENKMGNERIHIEFKPEMNLTQNNNNSVNVQVKVDVSAMEEFKQIKDLLMDIRDADIQNEEWQSNILKCLNELNKMEMAEDKPAQKTAADFIDRAFKKLKNLKDVVAITTIPVDINHKFPELLTMWETLKHSIFA